MADEVRHFIDMEEEPMSIDNATPAMWDAAARAAREMYHNKFVGTELQMPSVEYTLDDTLTETFGPLE